MQHKQSKRNATANTAVAVQQNAVQCNNNVAAFSAVCNGDFAVQHAAVAVQQTVVQQLTKKQRTLALLLQRTTIAAIARELNVSATAARSLIGDCRRAATHNIVYSNGTYSATAKQ